MACLSEYRVVDKRQNNAYVPFEFVDESVSESDLDLEAQWDRRNRKHGFNLIRIKWNRTDDLREAFRKNADLWKKETEFVSSVHDRAMHPAYQTILAMGKSALPLIFEELEANGGHWYWALNYLAPGADPVPPADRGSIKKMREAWLGWARRNHYL